MDQTIYHYDPATGVFTGADMARESPMEPGVFLLPAGATAEAPPAGTDNQRPVFAGGEWTLVDIPVRLAELPPSLEDAQVAVWARIKSERDRRRFEGGVRVGERWYKSDYLAVGEYNTLLNLSAGLPADTVLRPAWRTMDGGKVDMTPSLVKQILVAGFAQVAAIDDAAKAHKAAMMDSPDPAAYDFLADWPKGFGEEE